MVEEFGGEWEGGGGERWGDWESGGESGGDGGRGNSASLKISDRGSETKGEEVTETIGEEVD